jgi:hypothetical protein
MVGMLHSRRAVGARHHWFTGIGKIDDMPIVSFTGNHSSAKRFQRDPSTAPVIKKYRLVSPKEFAHFRGDSIHLMVFLMRMRYPLPSESVLA